MGDCVCEVGGPKEMSDEQSDELRGGWLAAGLLLELALWVICWPLALGIWVAWGLFWLVVYLKAQKETEAPANSSP